MPALATSSRCLSYVLLLAPKLDGHHVLGPSFATLSIHWVVLGILPAFLPFCLYGRGSEASRHEAGCKPFSEGLAEGWCRSLVNQGP